ncbi:hypothetical protein [Geobacillus stearothermophilus]|uniref:hypothetical protein n=1 Tax=Geobacillus stearothermophilus TaxID=1422 RepID=UPI002E1CED29|nr:hypothetical protein [Geobacillus stearothermophilus]MED3740132.1 hypothetical protein [Geobacillus stearothermophilus]MED3765987.1 hypothetical protein [Geobacillus stearothermophilus]MED3773712.1 hypothetical protein [Geobacillus stearothermophilus]
MSEKQIQCHMCNSLITRKSPTQKFCKSCSKKKEKQRKRNWAKKTKYHSEYARRMRANNKQVAAEKGKEINKRNKQSIFWEWETEGAKASTIFKTAIPFSNFYSKNSITTNDQMGVKKRIKQRREIVNGLTAILRRKTSGIDFYEDKVWIDIFIQKPNHRFDAINFIDFICDAIKEAINVDDRWFCIRRVDWEIVKDDPKIFIGISQAQEGHKRVCSRCGRILPLDMFWKDKSDRMGIGRECKTCMTNH